MRTLRESLSSCQCNVHTLSHKNSKKAKKILLIDDNHNITKMFSGYFKSKGHICIVANDGTTGLQFIENEHFDHILLDLSMPGFSGFDVLERLIQKNILQKRSISVLTASSISQDIIDDLLQKGVKTCIRKPVQLDTLLLFIEEENHWNKKAGGDIAHPITKVEKEKILLEEKTPLQKKTSNIEQENKTALQKDIQSSHKCNELEQENLILEEIVHDQEKSYRKTTKYYILSILIPIIITAIVFSNSYHHGQSTEAHFNYNSNYIIQDLKGDTVNTWVAWNIERDRILHVNIINNVNLSQDKIDAIKDAIMSMKTIAIDDSLLHKGPQGSSSTYYTGWEGAVSAAYVSPTKSYIPQKFDITVTPNESADIVIILTNDVSPDGLTGITKSLADGSEILKSKITIYSANELSAGQLEIITRHEFGHALGLAHSSAVEDLMHATIQTDYPYISECDVKALSTLYDGKKTSQVVCEK